MKVSVLGSGSSGNSAYIECGENSILIDAGLAARTISKRLSAIGKDVKDLDAVFVTHEHIDHIKGLEKLSRECDIYIKAKSLDACGLRLPRHKILDGKEIRFNDIAVGSFPVSHDAADPCGFLISGKGKVLGYATDLGKPDAAVKKAVQHADCMIIEANHDIDMLLRGPYPYPLKERILSDTGHLSNLGAGLLIHGNGSEKLRTIFLAHLSQINNMKDLAMDTFLTMVGKNKSLRFDAIMTSQNDPTELVDV